MRRLLMLVTMAAGLSAAATPSAASQEGEALEVVELAPLSEVRGRPLVKLDRLTLPKDLLDLATVEQHLRRSLAREARRADWGAGRGSTIHYRFTLELLEITEAEGALRIRCRALGQLPRGKQARSELSFGGDPRDRKALLQKVLEIVARGAIARLSELERQRRGQGS
jgi:hypothetical protein